MPFSRSRCAPCQLTRLRVARKQRRNPCPASLMLLRLITTVRPSMRARATVAELPSFSNAPLAMYASGSRKKSAKSSPYNARFHTAVCRQVVCAAKSLQSRTHFFMYLAMRRRQARAMARCNFGSVAASA